LKIHFFGRLYFEKENIKSVLIVKEEP